MLFDPSEKFSKEIKVLREARNSGPILGGQEKARVRDLVMQKISIDNDVEVPEARAIYFKAAFATAIGVFLVVGLVSASGSSEPGDKLFQVKKAAENVQVILAPSEEVKANLQVKFAENRLNELTAIQSESKADPAQQAEAVSEVSNAIVILQKTQDKLETRGNTQAAISVGTVITKLKNKLSEKSSDHGNTQSDTNDKNSNSKNGNKQQNGISPSPSHTQNFKTSTASPSSTREREN